jgi:hypothetical protein
MATVAITGNTFPVKDEIKQLGGKWDANQKAWMVPLEKAAEAQKLVAGAPKSAPRCGNNSGWGYDGAARKYTASKHPRTGCSCGSREGLERDSDCSSCRHDY